MDLIVVITTVETEADALRIARAAVEKRLAACVQVVGPIHSTYRWQGKVEMATEYRCELKTHADRFDALASLMGEIHPYEVPEVIALPVQAVSASYARWVDEVLLDG